MKNATRWGWSISAANMWFVLVTLFMVLVTHAIAYLTHEYSHALVAWSLGWMSSPWGIDYGTVTVNNVIFLADVSDNVDYPRLFAAGHGIAAAAIALAGPFLGNGLLYFMVYALTRSYSIKSNRYALMFFYWLALMCAGNVWSYAPIRSITTHADIALAAQGLGISTLTLFPIVCLPSFWILWHFMTRLFPAVHSTITARSSVNAATLIGVTGFWYFSFFGGGTVDGSYGPTSQIMSMLSRFLLFPLSVAYLSSQCLRDQDALLRSPASDE